MSYLDTPFTGGAVAFSTVQQHVAGLIKGCLLVGHSIWNDLSGTRFPRAPTIYASANAI